MIRLSPSAWIGMALLSITVGRPSAAADEAWTAKVEREAKGAMAGLEWSADELTVRPGGTGKARLQALLAGKFKRPHWYLSRGAVTVPVAREGSFRLWVPLSGETTRVELTAIGP